MGSYTLGDMAQSFEESLLQAIKKDDIKAFNALTEKARGSYRLGRFPVLSLFYLYKSKKLISAYEEKFLKITSFEELREPAEVSKKFSAAAGKCLRLYFDEIVSPLEMLLILDKTKRLTRIYPPVKPSSAVKDRLKTIYSIKYSLTVKFEGDNIIIPGRPLSYREKKNIATVCLSAVLAVTLAVGVPVTVVSLIPEPVEGEVTKLSQIDFSSDKEYTLKRDVVLPENYSVEKVNCKITGEGKKLVFGKGASLGEFNGKISDLTIESSGSPIFNSLSEEAVLEGVTINVNAAVTAAESTALVAVTNFGTIDGVTVNVSGKLNAAEPSEGEELIFGGLVLNNSYRNNTSTQKVYWGNIKNCTVNYSQFELAGVPGANAVFGGIAGNNSGYLQDCTVTGEINGDTFDIAGACAVNSGLLSGNVNEAFLSQTSGSDSWNPIVCGIVLNNTYAVEKCENKGNLSAVSDCAKPEGQNRAPAVTVAGIVFSTSNTVKGCINRGQLNAGGNGEACVGGIAAHSFSRISNCLSSGEITVKGDGIIAGGILGVGEVHYEPTMWLDYNLYWGDVFYCISECKINITATGLALAYAGGIAGLIKEDSLGEGTAKVYFGGGVTNCYYTGSCSPADGVYFGNIAGACGANIYEKNLFVSGKAQYVNFLGNYFSDNSKNALGTAVAPDGSSAPAGDMNKGAASASIDDIKDSEDYKSVLSALEK